MSKLLQERNQSLSPINGLPEINWRVLFYKHCIPTGLPDRLLRGLALYFGSLPGSGFAPPRAIHDAASALPDGRVGHQLSVRGSVGRQASGAPSTAVPLRRTRIRVKGLA